MESAEHQNRLQASPNYIPRQVAGQHMLISVGEGIADFNGYIQLNETAAFIWEQLKKPRTLRELTEAVSAEYDISTEQAAGDVDDFISDLEKQNMVMIYE
jgi:hypothetical protein